MTKEVVLKYLQKHGQKIDHEIVKDTGIDLKELRKTISELQSKNLIQTCTIIQHGAKGKLVEGIQCRIAGYTTPAAPGRKAPAAPPQ
jgi:hypothetical protein